MGGWTGYAIRQGASLAIPLGFLTFSRGFEKEADFLGLQYLYKTGYDPTAFVDFFEKIQSMEKKKPGSVAKVFSTHPMTDDRISSAQGETRKILTSKPEYVVNTSEFADVKGSFDERCTIVAKSIPRKTRAVRACGVRPAAAPIDKRRRREEEKPDQDERPTLKRRDN